MERLVVRVRGKVQGVWYRASAREEAGKLGLNGWVANRPDGTSRFAWKDRVQSLKDS